MYSFNGRQDLSLVVANWPFSCPKFSFPQDLLLPLYPVCIVRINLFFRDTVFKGKFVA